jgi:pSer/pThr/pTyr-binding forkhead associated (FHA) protein
MESLNGFIRRHASLPKDKFCGEFLHPFLASRQKPAEGDALFPGSWVIPIKKRSKEVLGDSITLGRGGDQDIRIEHESVSKHHCDFLVSSAEFRLADANSTNGTFVNGVRLTPHASRLLKPGDRIGFGETLVFFFFPAPELHDLLFGKKKAVRPPEETPPAEKKR